MTRTSVEENQSEQETSKALQTTSLRATQRQKETFEEHWASTEREPAMMSLRRRHELAANAQSGTCT